MGYYWPSHFTSLSLGCLWWMPRSEVRNKWDKYVKSLVQCLANKKHSKFDSYVKSPLPASSLVILCPRWPGRGDPLANSKNHPIKVCGIGLLENHIRAKKTRWQTQHLTQDFTSMSQRDARKRLQHLFHRKWLVFKNRYLCVCISWNQQKIASDSPPLPQACALQSVEEVMGITKASV